MLLPIITVPNQCITNKRKCNVLIIYHVSNRCIIFIKLDLEFLGPHTCLLSAAQYLSYLYEIELNK